MFKLLAVLLVAGLTSAALGERIRVGGNVQEQKLVKKVAPVYPPEAKAKGLEGTVKLEVVIDKEGKVKEVDPLSGPEELVPASVEAVKQWEYQPTLLNGDPAEVITMVTVNYRLSK